MAKSKKYKRLTETVSPIEFVNQDDMCRELSQYCYRLFELKDRQINELGKCVDDIKWDFNVPGVTIQEIKKGTQTIVMNPFFAEKLLDKSTEKYSSGNLDYEDEDENAEQYYELFRFALLWAAYLALVTKTSPISTSNPDAYVDSWKRNIDIVYSELIISFPEYKDVQDVFKTLHEEFTLSRI